MPKGHTQLQTVGNNTQVDPFGSNAAASLAYKQVERLVTATHMVTNHVPKSESLREKVRDITGTLLESTIKLREGLTSQGTSMIGNIVAQVRLLLSLLDALYASGLISEMNLRILKDAYIDFSKNLSASSAARSAEGVELTKEYFSPQITTIKQGSGVAVGRVGAALPSATQPAHSSGIKKQKSLVSVARVSTIIDFITKRGSASTGELAEIITGCSSKTLQRDLVALVASGKLTKTGHKRWTKYTIA